MKVAAGLVKIYGLRLATAVIFFLITAFSSKISLAALRVGSPLPRVVLTDLAGTPVTIPDNARGKVTIIHFWSTGCSSCREEIPALDRLYRSYGKGVAVYAVNQGQTRDEVRKAMSGLGVSYTVLLDPERKCASLHEVIHVPRTIILDRNGSIRFKTIGSFPPELLKKYVSSLFNR